MLSFPEEGKTGVPGEKPLGARERTNNKLNPHMASTPGVEPGPHWWEASALTTAPPLLPKIKFLSLTKPLFFPSGGVGRTACFIVIDSMLERVKHENTVDIYGHVTVLRTQRNFMVQTGVSANCTMPVKLAKDRVVFV